MKRTLFSGAGVIASLVVVAGTVMAGPHWPGSQVDPANIDVVARCPNDQLPIPYIYPLTPDPANPGNYLVGTMDRDEWALQCDVVTKKWKTTFYYEFNDDGMTVKRVHPLYPTFGASDAAAHYLPIWYPDLTKDATGKFTNCNIPATVTWVATCTSGCYAPEQELLFETGYSSIGDAFAAGKKDLLTLSPSSTREHIELIPNPVNKWTADYTEQKQQLWNIETRSGGHLRVTEEHPVMTEDGQLHMARDIHAGMSLVRADGTQDEVVDVQIEDFFGKTYNVEPTSRNLLSNIVVAQGFLNGSVRYQNEYQKYLNRLVLRERPVPAEVISGL